VLAAFAHPATAMPGIPDNHFRIRFSARKVIIFLAEFLPICKIKPIFAFTMRKDYPQVRLCGSLLILFGICTHPPGFTALLQEAEERRGINK
jgi:hypothetical protein